MDQQSNYLYTYRLCSIPSTDELNDRIEMSGYKRDALETLSSQPVSGDVERAPFFLTAK